MMARVVLPPDDFFEQEQPSGQPISEAQRRAAEAMQKFVQPKLDAPARSRNATCGAAKRKRVHEEMQQMCTSGDWSSANSLHLVALYAWLHEGVYGVLPQELESSSAYVYAASEAKRMLARDFAGDFAQAVLFLQWTWKREEGREQWRRGNGRSGGRIGWKLQFGGSLVTDWKIDKARTDR